MSEAAALLSIDPATEEVVGRFVPHSDAQVDAAIDRASDAFAEWRTTSFAHRGELMHRLADVLRDRTERYAQMITREMGKPISQARAEISKSAEQCDFYADGAEAYLTDEPIATTSRDSRLVFEPIGPVLAVMPWNFPFSQVTRFAVPAVMAGNTALLKHASNVSQCALAMEEAFTDAGFPGGVFQTLLLPSHRVKPIIADSRIRAVTVTGSSSAGAQIARAAGAALKKSVLELGGSDPFIVLADADPALVARAAARTRLSNSGQACAAGKRFIVDRSIHDDFEKVFGEALSTAVVGDPMDPATEVGPLARGDLLELLARQVRESVEMGARIVVGGRRRSGKGYFYEPTLLADCTRDMPVMSEETFGPVAALIAADDVDEALTIANDTNYGLGATIWTHDIESAKRLARRIEAGAVFINGRVTSNPAMPFGGIKDSGYGREFGKYGIREFVNVQSIVVGEF